MTTRPSVATVAITAFLRATRRKRRFSSAAAVREVVARQQAADPAHRPPRWAVGRSAVRVTPTSAGWPTYQVRPRGVEGDAGRILYLHGGGYITEIDPFQWWAATRIARAARAELVVPVFTLAPAATAVSTVAMLVDLAAGLLSAASAPLTLLGDSAGGGLALAVAQGLARRGMQPAGIVLVSPWLDVTMEDPASRAAAPRDVMLDVPGLAEAGRLYAGDLPLTDPRVSPLFGPLAGLAPMSVFSGTADLLNTDARRLAERARQAGVRVAYHEQAGGLHSYALMPSREGRAARRAIVGIVRSARVGGRLTAGAGEGG